MDEISVSATENSWRIIAELLSYAMKLGIDTYCNEPALAKDAVEKLLRSLNEAAGY